MSRTINTNSIGADLKPLPHNAIEHHVGAGVFLSRDGRDSLREWETYLVATEGRVVSVDETLSRLLVTFQAPKAIAKATK